MDATDREPDVDRDSQAAAEPLGYASATTEAPASPLSPVGVAAFIAAVVAPLVWLGLALAAGHGFIYKPPRGAARDLVVASIFGGPIVALLLGLPVLLTPDRRHPRRWPAAWAVTISGVVIAVYALVMV